tara:strand:+ start:73 stop:453 length:381 start_codon:yes stop_codon:yes gene_type:complete
MKKILLILLSTLFLVIISCYTSTTGPNTWVKEPAGDGTEWGGPRYFVVSMDKTKAIDECVLLRFNPNEEYEDRDAKGRPYFFGEPWENRFTADCGDYAKSKKPALVSNFVPDEIYNKVYPDGEFIR